VLNITLPKGTVELHNYSASNSQQQKLYNWKTLNNKVLKKQFNLLLSQSEIAAIVTCQRLAIERVLWFIHEKLTEIELAKQKKKQAIKPAEETTNDQNNNMKGSKEQQAEIQQLNSQISILSLKTEKLEQLLQLKNTKIAQLEQKLRQNGISIT